MRTIPILVLLAALGVSISASAEGSTSPSSVLLTDPVWKAGVSDRDLKQFYPTPALGGGVSGFAVISCKIDDVGELGGCAIWGEEPRGQGFGTALLKIAQYMRAAPTSASGAPTPGRTVRLGARFSAPSIVGVNDETVEVVTVRQ